MQYPKQSSWLPSATGRWTSAWITLATTTLFALLCWFTVGPIDAMGRRIYDSYFTLRGAVTVPDSVVIVAIDEASIRDEGHWPWPRERLAELVRRLDQAGAASMVFDIVWSEAQPGDEQLAAAIAASGRSILPLAFTLKQDEQAPVDEPSLRHSALARVEHAERFARYPPIHASGLLPPVLPLREAAQSLGSIQVFPDADGIFRWEPLVLEYDSALYPALSVAAAAAYLGLWNEDVVLVAAEALRLGPGHRVSTDVWGRTLIPYYGGGGSFRYYSATDVLSGKVGAGQLAGKVVMIGATAVGLHDQISTPFAALMPGVEKQATMIAALSEGRFITRAAHWLELAVLILVGVLVAVVAARPGIWWVMATYLLAIGGALFAGYALFRWAGLWFDISYLLANLLSASILVSTYKYIAEERLSRRIKGLFASYVHQDIVDELIRHPESARLGGGRRTVTVLFSDIRGFTRFSEEHSPEQVVARLNEYYTAMSELIFHHQGTLDKFIGDAIMAFWGAPLRQPDHTLRAVRCALDMIDRLERLNTDWRRRGEQAFECGIGIDCGEVLIGNIGAEGRKMDYTAIGDHVNIASRVEGLTKQHPGSLLITGHVVTALRDQAGEFPADVGIESVGETRVRGRSEAVVVYRCYRQGPQQTAGTVDD